MVLCYYGDLYQFFAFLSTLFYFLVDRSMKYRPTELFIKEFHFFAVMAWARVAGTPVRNGRNKPVSGHSFRVTAGNLPVKHL